MSIPTKTENPPHIPGPLKTTRYVGSGFGREGARATERPKFAGAKTTSSGAIPPSGSTTGVVRREIDESQSNSGEATKKGNVPAGQLPSWLRSRSASVRHERRLMAERDAEKSSKPLGLELDQQTKAILKALPALDPTPTTAEDYLQTHGNLLKLERTPQDHANSKQHYGKLRTSWCFGEVHVIRELRRASEKAMREKNMALAQALTLQAFERACALDWQCSTESWSAKAEIIKASGGKVVRKSKRYGQRAPTPTATAVNFSMTGHEKLWRRHELRILTVCLGYGQRS